MNKLVIIGNGFDLAHGLPTSYHDFLVWSINKSISNRSNPQNKGLIKISDKDNMSSYDPKFESVKQYLEYKKNKNLDSNNHLFIRNLIKKYESNWVDIETEYYKYLKLMCLNIEKDNNGNQISDTIKQNLSDLNECFDHIKNELIDYLQDVNKTNKKFLPEIRHILTQELKCFEENEKIYFLNFNYTTTIENYQQRYDEKLNINYIHGQINKLTNPIIFGYGDETDKHYKTIEDLNENEFTRHFKSFNYLTTKNYQELFEFLDKGEFNVYVMGHSCGISDRVLFTNIFNHDNFKNGKIQLYYYQSGKEEWQNDFFQKTQELSRHFDINSKHKMRTKVVPFNESKPLTPYKPKES